MNDVREPVRCLAAQIIGTMSAVSQTFLEQTLDKKLMSNMRMKKSSHERQVRWGWYSFIQGSKDLLEKQQHSNTIQRRGRVVTITKIGKKFA